MKLKDIRNFPANKEKYKAIDDVVVLSLEHQGFNEAIDTIGELEVGMDEEKMFNHAINLLEIRHKETIHADIQISAKKFMDIIYKLASNKDILTIKQGE